ncbi:MAG: Mur ligase family protein [Kiritimatiellia bacterium]
MKIWGITGTNGKTTCTWIFAEFLNATSRHPGLPPSQVRTCGYLTTVEAFDGRDRYSTGYTTPPLRQLKGIFAKMEAHGCTDCVMEVSSHAIHQRRTGDTVFAGGAFTNLSEDHLDYHGTMAEYFRVKASFAAQIAAAMPPPKPDCGRRDFPPFVVCLDGGYGAEMLEAVGGLPLNVIPVSNRSPRFALSALPLVGDYNRSNVLVAAALAEAAGVPSDVIRQTIPKLTPRWGRLERVANPRVKAEVYVDFAHTPDGLEKVLTAVRAEMNRRPAAGGALWVVFGAGGDRDPLKRPLMGEACAKLADRLVVTSDNPRREDPLDIIAAIVAPLGHLAGGERLVIEPDRARAIRYALVHAAAGDVVVIAGKGHETTQEIQGVKYPFDDRATVRAFGL